jgi:phage repressor protein C with HTH and peptisase S24 domain
MENMAQLINQIVDRKFGGNQSEFARYMGVSPQAVQKWVTGKNEPGPKNRKKLLELQASMPSQEVRETTAPFPSNVISLHREDPVPAGFVTIKQSKVKFSAGSGHEISFELIEDSRPAVYALEWFQEQQLNPERVRRFKVVGNSQEPMLYDGDSVLVNLAETEIIDGKLYAIRYGSDLRIKFLSRRLDGTLILRSVNREEYPDEEVPAHLANEHITIIGRVRDRSGRGGL